MTTRDQSQTREDEIYRLIADSEDSGMSNGQIAYLLDLNPGVVLRVLRRLERYGWIRREPQTGSGVRWYV